MSATPPPIVGEEWLRRVEAEYTSAAITAELVQWLIRLGAPPDLIREGLKIVDDELEHASLSHEVVVAAVGIGGEVAPPRLVQERLGLNRRPDRSLVLDVALHGVEIFCLGETVAVPLFVAMREGCDQPVARRALDRIVRDEVRHRDFGWALLQWLVEAHGDPMRAAVVGELPAMFRRLRASYGELQMDGADVPDDAGDAGGFSDEARRWGLMVPSRYAQILTRTLERDYRPRFGRVGIDAAAAWTGGR